MGGSITLEKSGYYRTIIKLRDLGYISQDEYDSYAQLEYLNQIGTSTTQQRIYWVR